MFEDFSSSRDGALFAAARLDRKCKHRARPSSGSVSKTTFFRAWDREHGKVKVSKSMSFAKCNVCFTLDEKIARARESKDNGKCFQEGAVSRDRVVNKSTRSQLRRGIMGFRTPS